MLVGDSDTICALSTAHGIAGISVIRVSGSNAKVITSQICPFLKKDLISHRAYFGRIINPILNEEIDEVLVTYFANNKSYTGEETIEISCHGGNWVYKQILELLINFGCRLANPGEFSYRSFINGKIDLTQAEGVLNIIHSQSKNSALLAMRQLKGDASHFCFEIENDISWLLAQLESNIDFSEEDIDGATIIEVQSRLENLIKTVSRLIDSYNSGRIVKDGLKIAIIGSPNVGKSSLLNNLIKEERSIVSDVPGTTRDYIESQFMIDGFPIHFVDTAGIRDTVDNIELEGIRRSYIAVKDADLVFVVFSVDDVSDFKWVDKNLNSNIWFIGNKSDLINIKDNSHIEKCVNKIKSDLNFTDVKLVLTNTLSEDGTQDLVNCIKDFLENISNQCLNSGVISQLRHYECFIDILKYLKSSLKLLKSNESFEFIVFELREALFKIYQVLGKQYDDQILDRVFKEFCLGK